MTLSGTSALRWPAVMVEAGEYRARSERRVRADQEQQGAADSIRNPPSIIPMRVAHRQSWVMHRLKVLD